MQLNKKEILIMFCPKCGAENADGSVFCNKCGNTLSAQEKMSKNNEEADKKIASAQVLNIVSIALLVVCLLVTIYVTNNNRISSSSTTNTNTATSHQTTVTTTSVTFEDYSEYIYITSIGSAILFFVGLAIYKSTDIQKKKKLALFYVIGSIPVCGFSVFATLINAVATCGLSFLLLACCIMQIVVGTKFYMATKLYEN